MKSATRTHLSVPNPERIHLRIGRVARRGVLVALGFGFALAGCDASKPCPAPDWVWDPATRACRSAVDAAADSGAVTDMGMSSLGATCTTATAAADCLVTATYCAQSPFDPAGYCTVRDCTLAPDDCPAGYQCTDAFVGFGAPQFCQVIPDAGP